MIFLSRGRLAAWCTLSILVASCSGSTSSSSVDEPGSQGGTSAAAGAPSVLGGGGSSGGGDAGAGGTVDTAGSGGSSAGAAGASSGSGGDTSADGTPMRVACTSNFGSALDTSFGRLDGYLVSIVLPGTHSCNGDDHHVHLQVLMHGSVYDVAIDTLSSKQTGTAAEVFFATKDEALVDGAWSEGWHTNVSLDYAKTLGSHSGDFTQMTESALANAILQELSMVNHISVFGTGYGPDGMHDIHRKSSGEDGCVVTEPLSGTSHYLLFHFSNQTF